MINQRKIGVVILNYKDVPSTSHICSLIDGYEGIDHIVIVDNLSPDGSYEKLQGFRSRKIDVIQSDRNGGYSYGNNFGAYYLMDKYDVDILVIANPDVEFTEDFLHCVVEDMEKTGAKAASGYMVMPPHAYPVVRNPKINSFWREMLDCTILLKHICPFHGKTLQQHTGIQEVEWIPGSLFAISAAVYRELHGLDDHVFLFYEEQILGKKFLDKGYRMIIDTDISYFHNHSVSINKSMKRYAQVRQLYQSKYFFYTEYGHISFAKRCLLRFAIGYGLAARNVLYRFGL